jgi:hypothetical protein
MAMYNKVFTKLLWHRRRKHDFGIMTFLRQLKITTDHLTTNQANTSASSASSLPYGKVLKGQKAEFSGSANFDGTIDEMRNGLLMRCGAAAIDENGLLMRYGAAAIEGMIDGS